MIKPRLLKQRELDMIRGKVMAGAATQDEMMSVFYHYDLIEIKMDELDCEDFLGTEGWRVFMGIPQGR